MCYRIINGPDFNIVSQGIGRPGEREIDVVVEARTDLGWSGGMDSRSVEQSKHVACSL